MYLFNFIIINFYNKILIKVNFESYNLNRILIKEININIKRKIKYY